MQDFSYSTLRYNQVRQKASHNSYQRKEGIYDQVLYWQVRSLEFDLHRGQPGQWLVYHVPLDPWSTSVHDLTAVANLCAGINAAMPDHEAITIFLEIASDGDFQSPDHTPQMLDDTLLRIIGRGSLFTPADLLAVNGSQTLRQAAQAGWPLLKDMRGKFLFVLNAMGRSTYCGDRGQFANQRACFFADDADDAAHIGRFDFIAFYNMGFSHRENAQAVFTQGYASRVYPEFSVLGGWSLGTARDWAEAVTAQGHVLATNQVNAVTEPWSRTDNIFGFPFQGIAAGVDPATREQRFVRGYGVGGATDPDAAFYAYDDRSAMGAADQAACVSVPGSHASESAYCGLMARSDLAADSPFLAVLRPAAGSGNGILVRYRLQRGGPVQEASVPVAPANSIDNYLCPFVRLTVSADQTRICAYGSAFGPGVSGWVQLSDQAFGEPLPLLGMAAHPGGTDPVDFLTTGLAGQALQFGKTAKIGPIDLGLDFAECYPPRVSMAAVVSLDKPMPSQDNRSSGDFNLQTSLPRVKFLRWNVRSAEGPASLSFNVMRDKSGGSDDILLRDVRIDARPGEDGNRKIYIATPQNATGNFVAEVQAVGYYERAQTQVTDFPLVAAVTSSPKLQPDQKHRSSGDFSVQTLPPGTQALAWFVWTSDPWAGISFNVMRDVSGGIDPYVFKGLLNGHIVSTRDKLLDTIRTLYIADPSGAEQQVPFVVTAYALDRPPPNAPQAAQVVSLPSPQPGQKHRSSDNFDTESAPADAVALVWEVSGTPNADSVRFDVKRDRFGVDPIIFKGLKNGDWTTVERSASLYIADPADAGGQSFTVTVKVVPRQYPA